MLDFYTERTGAGFWAEPVNALTNLAFIVAAALVLRHLRKHQATAGQYVLTVLLFAIGVGSFLFHTFATRWALMADVLPIIAFELLFLWCYGRNILHVNRLQSGLLTASLPALVAAMSLLAMGALGTYLPALIILTVLGILHYWQRRPQRTALLQVAALFALSLTFRTLDLHVEHCFPLGTHFLWHVLNAVLLGRAILALQPENPP